MVRQISLNVFGIGLLIFLLGIFQSIGKTAQTSLATVGVSSSTERNVAIKAAREAGQTRYSFTTRFTPGVGIVADPEQYRNDILDQLQDSIRAGKP